MARKESICIIGGGLSGLTLAYELTKTGVNVTLFEASSRLGGRIQTIQGTLGTPMELGATWFSEMHPRLLTLLDELGLKKYPQYSKGISLFQTKSFEPPQKFFIPEAENPSYRIAGGTQTLINALSQKLPLDTVKLNKKAVAITESGNELLIEFSNGERLSADTVVLCIPPQLASSQIKFSPELPTDVSEVLPTVQTWMLGSVKFVLEYAEPFWRNKGYSGMLYSHAGIVTEMYDHSNVEGNKFGFTGFLNGGASSYSQAVRKEFVLRQLNELLGEEALNPVAYFDKIWTDEFISGGSQTIQRPHQNNGHYLLKESYLNGKLLFSGTETASSFPGYMEGAISSALSTADRISELGQLTQPIDCQQ